MNYPHKERLGAVIRQRRKQAGLTLAVLGKRTDTSLGYLSQIELGKNEPSLGVLAKIATALGTTPVGILGQVYCGPLYSPPQPVDPGPYTPSQAREYRDWLINACAAVDDWLTRNGGADVPG